MKNFEELLECKVCGGDLWPHRDGEDFVCEDCGLVVPAEVRVVNGEEFFVPKEVK